MDTASDSPKKMLAVDSRSFGASCRVKLEEK